MKNNKETITQKVYDLLKNTIPVFFQSKNQKIPLLNQANIKLEILRHYFRLAYDLGLYNSNRYQFFAEKLHEIGRMTGGWLKSLTK